MNYARILAVVLFVYVVGCSNSPATDSGGATPSSTSSTSTSTSSTSSSSSSVFSPTYYIQEYFESNTGSSWVSKGSNVALTLESIGGNNAVKITGYSETKYGSTGIEVQWDLVGECDLSMSNFVISFDLYVPLAHNIQYVQFSFFNPSWESIYSPWIITSFDLNQWKSYSIEIVPTNLDYIGVPGGFEACTNMNKVRIQFGTQNPDTLIEVYLDNLIITNKY